MIIDNKYQITELIARGGQADILGTEDGLVVKLFEKTNLEGLKKRSGEVIHEPDPEEMALREAAILKKVERPDFPTYVADGFDQERGKRYIVMEEFPAGKRLDKLMADGMDQYKVVDVLRKVGDAVNYLHNEHNSRPVIHRDLKPQNIYVKEDGDIILHDFSTATSDGFVTGMQTTAVATALYIAPEVAQSASVSRATDVYGLGLMGMEMLFGQKFRKRKGFIQEQDFQGMNVSKPLEETLLKATQLDPKERYQTIDEFVGDLESTSVTIPENNLEMHHRSRVLNWSFEGPTIGILTVTTASISHIFHSNAAEQYSITTYIGGLIIGTAVGHIMGELLAKRKNKKELESIEEAK